ncbi:hypothetical protein G6F35_014439 [Rhizopus arrhizus]|nr:hypothetical protein G6F35_014439 [Rhizopus arrhizus]
MRRANHQGGLGRTLGDDAPAGRRNRCIPGQHRHAQVVAHLLGAALATHHRLYRRIADHVVTDPLAIGVIEQATMTVDHVQVGTVAVVVLAQQRMQCAALAQVQGPADVAAVVALAVEDRVRQRHQQLAGGRLVRIADHRLACRQCRVVADAVQHLTLQLQGLRRSGDHQAIGIHHQRGVEAVGLQLQAAGLILRPLRIQIVLAEPGGRIGKLLLCGQQEVLGGLGQLAGRAAPGSWPAGYWPAR